MGGFLHGHTYGGNPVACAAGLAVLQEIDRLDLIDNAAAMGEVLKGELEELSERFPFVGDVRGKGLLLGAEIYADPVAKKPLPRETNANVRLIDLAFERGLIVYSRRVRGGPESDNFMVCPPLIVTREEIGEIMAVLGDTLEALARRARPAGQPLRARSMAKKKVVITCAVTGSVHTPTMSPYLPVTPDQIAAEAIAAAEAGASILHLHARDPENGRPTADPDVFMQFLPRIKQATDAVINITTGGSSLMTLDQRLAAPLRAEPEMCSLNMGSMNFALFPMLDKPREWKHEWEPKLLEATRDTIFKNTFADMETVLEKLGRGCGTRFEFECYDVGHLYSLAHFRDRGLVTGPLFIQFVFGILGGIGADPENLTHMKRIADKLFGADYEFSVLAAGRHQMPMLSIAAAMGGNVRVGLEDSLYDGRALAKSNADQVRRIRKILDGLSLEVATPAEAREMLALKGGDRVAF